MNSCAAMTPTMASHGENIRPCGQRILLRYWAAGKRGTPVRVQDLPNFEGRVAWAYDDADAGVPDLAIHLIEPSYLQAAPAAKLRAGQCEAAAAMRRGFRRGDKEIALVLGSAASIPQKRYGCWIASDRRTAKDALDILARILVLPALDPDNRHRWNLHDLADANVLCVLATESADDREGLARQVIGALSTALGLSHVPPARIIVAAQEPVIAAVASAYPIDREQVNLVRRIEATNDLTADMLVAYPWPTDPLK